MKNSIPYLHRPARRTGLFRAALLAMLLTGLLAPGRGVAQEDPAYEETSVTVNVQRIGSFELPALVRGDSAYLSVSDLFNYLRISNSPSQNFDTLSGFFMDPQAVFLLLKKQQLAQYKNQQFRLDSGALIGQEGSLYMRTDYFNLIFQLRCSFNFRSLSVMLSTDIELPVMREMRQAMVRSNMSLLKGEWKADTVVTQRGPFFGLGMADWSFTTKQQIKGLNEAALNLTLGARLAGGEVTAALNYYNLDGFRERQQMYQWRYVNNGNAAVRQLVAGKFFTQSISTIYNPVVGVQVTNTPSVFRRSFGTYTLSNVTEPGWMVELYVNDVLVNYVKADVSGFFTFEVPLVYGNSAVRLRFYGPYGEEQTREGNVLIPFNFLPRNEFNYSVSAGIVEDSVGSRFTRATLNYGLSRRLTFGGGMEYLSSIPTNEKIPFVNTAMMLASNLMFSGEYAYGVRTKGLLTYHRPSNLQVELTYTRYRQGQKAIQNNFLEEKNLLVSIPIRTRHFVAFSRLTINQRKFPRTEYTSGEMLLSASLPRVSANLTTYTLFNTPRDYLLFSTLALNFRLMPRLSFMPQMQFEHRQQKISMAKAQVDKQLSRNGYLTFSYEKNFYYHMTNAGIGFRYDFRFAQTFLSTSRSNHRTAFIQSARGSLLYDRNTGYLDASCRSSVGRGGVVVLPYLDLNGNGKRDAGEPKVAGLKVRVREGTVQYVESDTAIRVLNLEPYQNAFIALDSNSFENIAWRLAKKTYSVYIEANQFKLIEVPVQVQGEVSGTVFTMDGTHRKGVGKVALLIYNQNSVLVKRLQTESDGYFSHLGLPPGEYTVRLDPVQLERLRLTAAAASQVFHITFSSEGDVADGLEFELRPLPRKAPQREEEDN